MVESWKQIDGYNGLYEVSNQGEIKSLHRKGKVLKPRVVKGGYLQVVLYGNNEPKALLVHRIVATTFIENPSNKTEVNHINGDKTNNSVDNLEWVTRSENQRHAFETGLNSAGHGETSRNHKLTEKEVNEIRASYIPYDKRYGANALAKKYNVSHQHISDLANNKKWKGGINDARIRSR